jgi:hypothetical protein
MFTILTDDEKEKYIEKLERSQNFYRILLGFLFTSLFFLLFYSSAEIVPKGHHSPVLLAAKENDTLFAQKQSNVHLVPKAFVYETHNGEHFSTDSPLTPVSWRDDAVKGSVSKMFKTLHTKAKQLLSQQITDGVDYTPDADAVASPTLATLVTHLYGEQLNNLAIDRIEIKSLYSDLFNDKGIIGARSCFYTVGKAEPSACDLWVNHGQDSIKAIEMATSIARNKAEFNSLLGKERKDPEPSVTIVLVNGHWSVFVSSDETRRVSVSEVEEILPLLWNKLLSKILATLNAERKNEATWVEPTQSYTVREALLRDVLLEKSIASCLPDKTVVLDKRLIDITGACAFYMNAFMRGNATLDFPPVNRSIRREASPFLLSSF